ncbi:AsmA family protein [Aquicoccus sp. G2-2]|uniref:AsmA family protein n=1 Tax=Aquicoccus sp. G2-2 TaxID=3092120 RepID=UPI002ADFAD36|nr:AsmA family protein [Aquicoccus sp. G2-2]MEA1112222.1 AsmA family protein [Aquicoccus sp. G2-2]
MRWIFRILGALVVAALLLAGALFMLPGQKIAQVAARQIEAMTGRNVSFDGDVSISFFPVLGVKTGPVTVANAKWSKEGPLMTAKALSIGVETMPLLSGQIKIRQIEVQAPDITLERNKAGEVNWTEASEGGTAGAAASSGKGYTISLDKLEIADGRLRYLDHASGTAETLETLNAQLAVPNAAGTATFSLTALRAGAKVAVSGTVGGLQGLIDGKVVPLNSQIKAGGGAVVFTGKAALVGDAQGKFSANLSSTGNFLAALGIPGVSPPAGLGQRLQANGLVVVKGGNAITLRKMTLGLDQNELTGEADINLAGAVPKVKARLSAKALDFAALTEGDSGGSGESAASDTGWSKAKIDASALAAVNGQMRLTASSIDVGMAKLGASDVTATLDNSRVVFSLNKVAAYGGELGGEFVVNNRGGLSVGGKLGAKSVEVKDALSDLGGITRLSGQADVLLNFLGSGSSVDAIMHSLKGDGRVVMDKGTISGFDLNKLMSSGNGSGGTTIFDTLTATFAMAGGNLDNQDLKMSLPSIEATGKGRVGLGARDIDYLFTPVALKLRGGKGLVIPVRIKGAWASPKIIPDLNAVIDLNFSDEKKALKENVEGKVKEKLKQQLDVDVQDGQSVGDAVKQKAQDELMKGLQDLLK